MNTSAVTHLSLAGAVLVLMPLSCLVDGPEETMETGNFEGETGTGAGGDNLSSSTSTSSSSGQSSSGSTSSGGEECPYEGPSPLDVSTLPACPDCATGGAHCLPTGLVPGEFIDQLANCDPDTKCVPDKFIETTGLFIAKSCNSVAGVEGRCLSPCIPQIAEQANMLPQDICEPYEVCAPCYDPTTGEDTSACSLSCDPGPVNPPEVLPKCCDGVGTCVPPEIVDNVKPGQSAQLGEDTCPQHAGKLVCSPDVFVNDPNWQPQTCQTSLITGFFGEAYAPGACLPDCIPAVKLFLILQDGCPDGMKCAPCLTPPFGTSSGACDL
ncbi:MAG: hypothetical protein JRI68_10905 [Deltaproteobacteria bacterium]|nr:hypothetical protein [Deltaproteobacteria bacterium]